ncbi:GTP-binding proten HflX [Acetohalobium arabaticum DSM 5501]|uniref:GTPase HflX n=1 Tax=Acetohalobium arabaticum (strain ATCC 49924 / DSM 5501 / Z-7288) TaxID=574087 RepID=D9QU24_ACEAZ|nr:GTP-binding proten HflX [Acetohalobium arabaticum DSM 5501]
MVLITDLRGDLSGIKDRYIEELEMMSSSIFSSGELVAIDFLYQIINIASEIEDKIAVLINRRGEVLRIKVGELTNDFFAGAKQRRSVKRLSGLRCIYLTFNSQLNRKNKIFLKEYRLDLLVHLSLADRQSKLEALVHYPKVDNGQLVVGSELKGPFSLTELTETDYSTEIEDIEDKLQETETVKVTEAESEAAVLVCLITEDDTGYNQEEPLAELENLVQTAGIEVKGKEIQYRKDPDHSYYIGYGKVQELKELKYRLGINVIIFDEELSPAQQRNLEDELGVKVIDRTEVILDIFAQHANSKEGKLQVELAQLHYLLPRLTGKGEDLSRLAGGIGTRGPGESKLEIDRRRIRKRIDNLEAEINRVQQTRATQRSRRKLPTISLVGYTNAGKSTLLNRLTEATAVTKDELFATLDSNTCRLKLPVGRKVLISDTVGFIRKLPHQLIAAFRATLEEVTEADILLHVVDVTEADYKAKMDAVVEVLSELNVLDKPIITILNKIDLLKDQKQVELIQQNLKNSLVISAKEGQGVDRLLDEISNLLLDTMVELELLLPYSDAGALELIHQRGKVLREEYSNEGISIKARISQQMANQVDEDYIIFRRSLA